jgi:GNAT superfamily N-acetyltransferase
MPPQVTNPGLPEGYQLVSGVPPPSAYLELRGKTGLSPKTMIQASAVPSGTWYGCYITFTPTSGTSGTEEDAASDNIVIVGMGRIIGDGAWYFHIADMAVLPDHQRKGLGDAILKELLSYIRAHCLALGEGAGDPYVTLLADPPGRKLYQRNGFVETAPRSLGMKMESRAGWWL